MGIEKDTENIPPDSLVLYKKRPARVARIGEKLEIELEGGNLAKVRSKDVVLLHPGPLKNLNQLQPQEGEVELAWEILSENLESPHKLTELTELIFGQYTPATTWAAWQFVEDGLYFRGSPEAVITCSSEEVARQKAARKARAAEAQAWTEFRERARAGDIAAQEDAQFLKEVEELALGRKKESRLLRELGRSERPENAHALLLESGYWSPTVDPYPIRLRMPAVLPDLPLPPLPDEPRQDLTNLPAFAIDDRGNNDPDDAISLVSCTLDSQGNFLGGRIWVHIADVAALVPPDSEADLEARSRGVTLYLPEGAMPMLPRAAVQILGLGLNQVSPALSFGLEINASGEIVTVEIQPSRVSVERLSYEQAEDRMDEEPFLSLYRIAQIYQTRRQKNGALFIDLPESIVRVVEGQVTIQPISRLCSRNLVRETMLMVGEAAARFVIERGITFLFAAQEAPDSQTIAHSDSEKGRSTDNLASHFALRRILKRSQVSSFPAPHAGVGLPAYSRATSPLRRYQDLLAHQQLRAYLSGESLLSEGQILERAGISEAATTLMTQVESLARRHWTLVYLMQHSQWQGEGVLVEREGLRGTVIIPELALETPVHLFQELPLNSRVPLALSGVNLAELDAHFIHQLDHSH
jgi:exoribonuclease-2